MAVKMFMSSVSCAAVYLIALQSGPEKTPAAAQAQVVFDQMFAANRSVKTLELSFEVTENSVIAGGSVQPEVRHWQGTFRAALPSRYRIEYSEEGNEDHTTGGVDADGNYRALTWSSIQRVYEGGISRELGAELFSGPSLNRFVLNHWLGKLGRPFPPYWPERADLSGFTLKRVNRHYVLEGTIPPDPGWMRLTVDPARGYSVVRTENALKPGGAIRTTSDIEYAEIVPGIWIAQRGTAKQMSEAGAIMTEWEFKAAPETTRVNAPLDTASLDIEFPNGTRVSDLVARRSYYVGGDTRDARIVEGLAAQMEELGKSQPRTREPVAGGLSAVPPLWQRLSPIVIPMALAAAVVALLFLRRSKRVP
jgi:hypothetical protein